jgi:hypothetical protein
MLPLARALAVLAVTISAADVHTNFDLSASRRQRVDEAAREAFDRFSEWFAPIDAQPIEVALPLFATSASMDDEARVAAAVARKWWGERVRFGAGDQALADELCWYLQGHIVQRLFDRRYEVDAYALESRRFFGGFVPWQFAGLYVDRTARPHVTFAAIERHLSWPVLQRALRAVFQRANGSTLDRAAMIRMMSDAAGQDVRWFFAHPSASFALAGVDAPNSSTSIHVSVTDAPPFGVPVRVTFQDGQHVSTTWRRAADDVMSFESAVPAIAVEVDPDRTLLNDRNYLDNRWSSSRATDVPVAKWAARWLVWLQNVMLTSVSIL